MSTNLMTQWIDMKKYLAFICELRKRLLTVLILYCILFIVFFIYSSPLFHWFVLPLLHALPKHEHMIATLITTPLLTPIHVASNLSFLCTTPYGLYHVWHYVTPALYKNEQRHLLNAILLSCALFVLGAVFCYFCILPYMFLCITNAVPHDVVFLPDMSSATAFITGMMLVFGLSFQVPLICLVMVTMKVITIEQLTVIRPYIIVSAFILGMILTPPDVISQILLAIPLWGLYELGIWLSAIKTRKIFVSGSEIQVAPSTKNHE